MSGEESTAHLVFLLDVDNTLLDNDRLKGDLAVRLGALLGSDGADTFWKVYERVRGEEEYVDFPETVRLWTEETGDQAVGDQISNLLAHLDFPAYLFPDVIATIEYLWTLGTVVILSDGDAVFQRYKIRASGLAAAVRDNILIYVHKELELPSVFARFPAEQYVMVDDKPRILAALERECPAEFTTVLVLQGKYAIEHQFTPEPDFVIKQFEDLRTFTAEELRSTRRRATSS